MKISCHPSDSQRLAARERPSTAVVMKQRWSHLLFLHWEIDAELVQQSLPKGLTVDTLEGKAYIGVVPFFMQRIRPVYCPPVPGLSWFQELNVRTYVYDEEGRPGVWFYSLDCNQWLAVKIARKFFNLPYQHARMSAANDGVNLSYQSQRRGDAGVQKFVYPSAIESACESRIGSLEFFLLERYRLFSVDKKGGLYQGVVNHKPYEYRAVSVECDTSRLISLAGFEAPDEAPISSIISKPVDVSIFPLRRI